MNIPGTKPTEDQVEKAAILAAMESGLINGLSFDTAREVVEDLDVEKLNRFVESTQERAQGIR